MEDAIEGRTSSYKESIEEKFKCKLDTNMELDEFSRIGQAWKTFSKLMKEKELEKELGKKIGVGDGTLKSGHICVVLKGIGFALYFYELIDEYTEEQLRIFEHIRLILDKILMRNQNASQELSHYLRRYLSWRGEVFPKFFGEIDREKILSWSDQIDKEIEEWSNIEYEYEEMDREELWREIITSNSKDIKECYGELLSILNTIKPDLPKENISMIEELILRCEHGYYLGFQLERVFEEYKEKHPAFVPKRRTKNWRKEKLYKFRYGREQRILEASTIAFGMSEELKEKLRRMFVAIEV